MPAQFYGYLLARHDFFLGLPPHADKKKLRVFPVQGFAYSQRWIYVACRSSAC